MSLLLLLIIAMLLLIIVALPIGLLLFQSAKKRGLFHDNTSERQLPKAEQEIPFFDEDGKSPTERMFESRRK